MAKDRPQIGANWLEDIIFLNKSTTAIIKPFEDVVDESKEMRDWEVEYSILTDDDMQGVFDKLENASSIFSRDREMKKQVLAMSLKTINGIPVYMEDDFEDWKSKKTDAPRALAKLTIYDYKRDLIGSWEPMIIDFFYNGYQQIVKEREEELTGKIKKSPPPPIPESDGRLESEQDSIESSESESTD